MRIVFAGTPDFAAAHLQALLDAEFEVVAVYSQPDRPAGRGKKLQPSAVKQLALTHNIPVEQPVKLSSEEAQQQLSSYQPDLMVVVAYGLLLPKAVLDIPTKGCLNVHGSILPKWRGAAPIQRAIWAGDEETGVAIMQMDVGLDTGDVINIATLPITPEDTSATLYTKLAELGPKTLTHTLANLDSFEAKKQDDSLATYAKKLSKEEAKCDWQLSAEQIERNVRAFNPWPVVWFPLNAQPVKVWQAEVVSGNTGNPGEVLSFDKNGLQIQCSDGVINITELQLPNKKRQPVSQIVNGNPDLLSPGDLLS
ncbi:methionyl-tRNA formyltransferase [Glaciecola sp. 1036]|uniref:methionyl-tRNA formyltransferase n=1 Tax=Alteromonadaceae TaxID=72275 RepID=UPI003CFD241C